MSNSLPQAHYRVHLDEQTVVEVDLDLARPIYQLAGDLAQQHGLGQTDDGYTFFVGADRRPLIRELPLSRTPYGEGGELYLAPINAPWWVSTAENGAAPAAMERLATPGSLLQAPSLRTAVLGSIVIITLAALGWLFWPGEQSTTEEAATTVPVALVPTSPTAGPTATLLPAPTPLPAPTVDPAMEASVNYQNGLIAYDKQDWAEASRLLQQVYDYNSSYLNIRDVLSAAYYNRGIWTRDEGDVAAALEHFASALRVTPEHQLALAEQELAQLYLDGLRAIESDDPATGVEMLRALVARQPNYADAPQQLYEALVGWADALVEGGEGSTLQSALALYQEAAALDVADHSVAEKGAERVAVLLPTPTPRPTSTPSPVAKKLRFRVLNYNDDAGCISVSITGIVPAGWFFVVDGIGLVGRFDGGGNARVCGLGPGQEVTISVLDGNGTRVAGGGGVPSKGSAIMVADWR